MCSVAVLTLLCVCPQLWKSRYAVVDGNTLTVYRNEADAKANKDARMTLTLNDCKMSAVRYGVAGLHDTPDITHGQCLSGMSFICDQYICSEPDGTAGRVVPRILMDGGRAGGKWMIQTKNPQELQVRQASPGTIVRLYFMFALCIRHASLQMVTHSVILELLSLKELQWSSIACAGLADHPGVVWGAEGINPVSLA